MSAESKDVFSSVGGGYKCYKVFGSLSILRSIGTKEFLSTCEMVRVLTRDGVYL
jgi:hypothetical protein